ncbi:MAG: trypsin-like peptidase domain-containing protein [Acidobacteriota bacterium]
MKRAAVCVVLLLFASVAAAQIDPADVPGPLRVGEEVRIHVESAPVSEAREGVLWSETLTWPGATYIAPHFSYFALPAGAELVVRAPDHSRSWTYTGFGKADSLINDGFWGIHIAGDTAILELHATGPVKAGAVVIDGFAHGDESFLYPPPDRSICGVNDVDEAKCYQSSHPAEYAESRAVARLLINGVSACTGWLIGDQGHLMTNEHCIGSSATALNTDYEFMAEGASCATNCKFSNACPGTVVATSATLIQLDAPLDYALVQLPTNPSGTYGFMQLRSSGASLGEQIYIPGHPAIWGKQFALESTHPQNPTGFCEVDTLTAPGCGNSINEVGYYCDTQGGSSGSPVLANSDNCVVALHHCRGSFACTSTGGDHNRGVPVQNIITDLGSNLPANALCGATGGGDFDLGTETIDEITRTVSISGVSSPRVVMGPVSLAGADPGQIRITNAGSSSFQHRFQEWDYLDGTHTNETAGWLALPNGASSIGSLDADAGSVSVDEVWVTVNFAQSFSAAPVVISSVTTFNGSQGTTTRVRNVTANSFQVRLQEEEGNDDNHAFETVHWVAIETGSTTANGHTFVVGRTGNSVTHNFTTINFGQSLGSPVFLAAQQTFDGGDTATVRYQSLTASSVQVQVDEETSGDTEVSHTTEVVGYIAISN